MAADSLSALSPYTRASSPAAAPAPDTANLRRRAVEFEALLLGNVLEKLEHTYGCVPGEEPADAAHDTQASLATQALAGGLAKAGGIGLARMVLRYLPQPATESGTPQTGQK